MKFLSNIISKNRFEPKNHKNNLKDISSSGDSSPSNISSWDSSSDSFSFDSSSFDYFSSDSSLSYSYKAIPINTSYIRPGEPYDVIIREAGKFLEDGDFLVISETPIAISQGRLVDEAESKAFPPGLFTG